MRGGDRVHRCSMQEPEAWDEAFRPEDEPREHLRIFIHFFLTRVWRCKTRKVGIKP